MLYLRHPPGSSHQSCNFNTAISRARRLLFSTPPIEAPPSIVRALCELAQGGA
ncbi:MAG: hypothetical protein AB7K24_04765 [Gemmataceae bacterium]